MGKKEILSVDGFGSLGDFLSKLGVVLPTEKTPESETAKVVKRLLKELDSWDGNSLSDRLNYEVGMDGMDIIEFIMKLEEELDVLVEAENLFLTEQDMANDYYGVEEDDENEDVQEGNEKRISHLCGKICVRFNRWNNRCSFNVCTRRYRPSVRKLAIFPEAGIRRR